MRRYLFIIFSVSFLPLITLLPRPGKLLVTIPDPPSSPSSTLTGYVENYSSHPQKSQIFVELAKKTKFRLLNWEFSLYVRFAPLPLTASGSFTLKDIPPGYYRVTPLTLPQLGIYFPRSYPVTVSGIGNPPPVVVSPPLNSIRKYLISLPLDTFLLQ